MRMLMFAAEKMWKGLVLGALALALATPASAGAVFAWTTDEGIRAYTNDARRIPFRYKNKVRKTVLRDGLKSYPRYTPRDAASDVTYADRLYTRVVHLRALNARLDARAAQAATTPPGYESVLRVDRNLSLNVPNRGQEPLVVEKQRVRVPGSNVTRTVTVVRQGDRVISVQRPMSSSNGLTTLTESDLFE